MKKSYPTKLIWDYIRGEEIENIDELEADYKFMMEVIERTKDKRIYFLCADEVKANKDFVLFLIDMFKEDKEFIINVANYYLKIPHDDSDYSVYEVAIRMQQILEIGEVAVDRRLYKTLLEYSSALALFYLKINLLVSKTIEEESDQKIKNELGLGFGLIKEGGIITSSIIQDYLAECFLEDILRYEQGKKLEKVVHIRFSFVSSIERIGIYPFLLSYIGSFDPYLKKHVETRLHLLSNMVAAMKRIEKNWDNYEENHYHDKMNIFYEIVNKKIEKYHSSINSETYFRYIDKMNLGIKTKLGYYPDNYNDDQEMKDLEIEDIKTSKIFKINEYQCLIEIIALAKKLFSKRIVDLDEIEKEELVPTLHNEPENSHQIPAQIVAFPKRKKINTQ